MRAKSIECWQAAYPSIVAATTLREAVTSNVRLREGPSPPYKANTGANRPLCRAVANFAAQVLVASSGATDRFGISCYLASMNWQEIIAMLRKNEPTLRARGVSHAAVGSRARGDNRPDSDMDIMIEFDPAAQITVFNYAGLKDYIAGLFDGPVDVVNRDGLKPYVRPAATADAIYAF